MTEELNKFDNKDERQYESLHAGEIVTTVMQDVQKIEDLYLSCIPNLCFAIIHGATAMLVMMYYNILLGILAIVLGLIQITVSRKTGKSIRKTADERQKAAGSVLQQVMETLDGREDIEGCNAEVYFCEKFENSSSCLAGNELKARQASGNVAVADNLLNLLNRLVIMGVGLMCVQRGYLSVGVIAAILNLQGNATYLFQNYTSFSVGLANCIPSIERIVSLLKLENEQGQSCHKIDASGLLTLENVDFAYQENQKVLQDITMNFEKGKFYCIVGESGSGKSTLQKILLKFYEPQGGTYKIGGFESKELSYEEIRKQFAYVAQNSNLFAMSVGDNLRLVSEDAGEQELTHACKEAEAYDFIMKQGGYDYEIDSSLNNISGGQKQRIELARMFLSDRPVWLIDEGTSHLDKDTEKKVMEHIMQYKKDKIIIMITHHDHLLAYADVVYRLESD